MMRGPINIRFANNDVYSFKFSNCDSPSEDAARLCGWPLNVRCPNRVNAEYMRQFRALYFSFCYHHGLPYYLVSQLAIIVVMFTVLTHGAYVYMANTAVDRVPNGFNWLIAFVVCIWLNRRKAVVLGNTRIEIKWL